MLISSCEPNSTTSDYVLQIPDEESHNDEQVSLKKCLPKKNDKAADLTNRYQLDLSLVAPKDDEIVTKDSSPHTDFYPY